jgi:hypothetical protein
MVCALIGLLLVVEASAQGRPVAVRVEPPDAGKTASARVGVMTSGRRRPPEEQLVLEGAPRKPSNVVKTPSGRVLYSSFEREVAIAGDRLTTLHVGRTKIMVALKPGSILGVRFDDCANWALESKWLPSADYHCERDERPCKRGYLEGSEQLHADDSLCSKLQLPADASVKFCVRHGEFRVRGKPGTAFKTQREGADAVPHVVPASGLTEYLPALYERCGRDVVMTASDNVVLAIGSGERWTIELGADGRIAGGVAEGGPSP